MPKLKTNSGAKKRFRKRSGGSIKCGQSHCRHILTKKSAKRKRQLRRPKSVHFSDQKSIARLLQGS